MNEEVVRRLEEEKEKDEEARTLWEILHDWFVKKEQQDRRKLMEIE